jgi:predicted transposase YdaD
LKYELDTQSMRVSAKREGRKEGRAEGRQEAAIEFARKLKAVAAWREHQNKNEQ